MVKGNISFVDRCNNKKTVLEVFTSTERTQSSFIRDKKQIIRFSGPVVPMKVFEQVRAIFYQSENIIKFKQALEPEKKSRLRPISRSRITAHERKRFSTLDKAGIKYLSLGWIEINRWDIVKNRFVKKPMRLIDMPTAIRQQGHILDFYKRKTGKRLGELPTVLNLREIIGDILRWLVSWKEAGYKKREQIEHEIARIVLGLDFVNNYYKVEVRDRLVNIMSLEDVFDRLNPPAMAANIVPILGLLAARLEEIRAIVPAIALRHKLLKFEKMVMDAEVKNSLIKMKAMLHKNNDEILKNKKNAEIRITQTVFNLYRLHASPYYEVRQLAINLLYQAKNLLNPQDINRARQRLKIVRHVLSNEL